MSESESVVERGPGKRRKTGPKRRTVVDIRSDTETDADLVKKAKKNKEPAVEVSVHAGTGVSALLNAQGITAGLRQVLSNGGMMDLIGTAVLSLAAKYEVIIAEQMATVCHLEGRLEERAQIARVTRELGTPAVRQRLAAKPSEETYAVVLATKSGDEATSDQVKAKVLAAGTRMNEFVCVKAVRKLPGGKVAVVARTQADVNKIKSSPAIKETGLKMTNPKLAEPHLVVTGVPNELTSEAFITDVVAKNLTGVAKPEDLAETKIVRRFNRKEIETGSVILSLIHI